MKLTDGETTTFATQFTQEQFNRFAALSGDDNPIHVDPDFSARTKFGRTVAHGMFLYANVCRVLGEIAPGAVQLEQELMFPAPTFTDEPVEIHLTPTGYDSDGQVRLDTKLIKGDGQLGLQGNTLLRLPGTRGEIIHDAAGPHGPEWRGLAVGQSAALRRTYSRADLEEYLDLLDETNPLYTDPSTAVALGLRGVPLPGPLFGAMFSCLLGTDLPGRGTNWLKQRFSFRAAAYPGDELLAQVRITRIRPEKDLVNLRTWINGPHGELLCDGEALVWVSDLEDRGG